MTNLVVLRYIKMEELLGNKKDNKQIYKCNTEKICTMCYTKYYIL